MDVDKLWKMLDAVQSQIRALDTKAQIVIAINGVLAAFFSSNAEKFTNWAETARLSLLAGTLTLICIAVSVGFAVHCIRARTDVGQPRSRLFFAHLYEDFGAATDYAGFREVAGMLEEGEFRADVENQILANASIASFKARAFKFSVWAMTVGYALWLMTIGLRMYAPQAPPQLAPSSSINYFIDAQPAADPIHQHRRQR